MVNICGWSRGTATGGDLNITGIKGFAGRGAAGPVVRGGDGGGTYWGTGGQGPGLNAAGSTGGFVGKTIGSGGSGAANTNNATVMAGAVGATGAIVVIEYISV